MQVCSSCSTLKDKRITRSKEKHKRNFGVHGNTNKIAQVTLKNNNFTYREHMKQHLVIVNLCWR